MYFIYDAGAFTPLALPAGCSPDGINDSEEIVGNCLSGGVFQGFLYKSGIITYITYENANPLNHTIIRDINDSGEIVGIFLDVPEASTLLQLGIGLLFLAGMTLRLKRLA